MTASVDPFPCITTRKQLLARQSVCPNCSLCKIAQWQLPLNLINGTHSLFWATSLRHCLAHTYLETDLNNIVRATRARPVIFIKCTCMNRRASHDPICRSLPLYYNKETTPCSSVSPNCSLSLDSIRFIQLPMNLINGTHSKFWATSSVMTLSNPYLP